MPSKNYARRLEIVVTQREACKCRVQLILLFISSLVELVCRRKTQQIRSFDGKNL